MLVLCSLATGFTAAPIRNDARDPTTSSRLHSAPTDYYIEQSETRSRALDVQVFRGLSSSAGEHRSEQRRLGNDISEREAVNLLMEKYDESGRYVACRIPGHEPQTYFVALYNYNTDAIDLSHDDSFDRQNGIVGVVSAQLRRKLPLIVGTEPVSSASWGGGVIIPSPHVYIANMSVDIIMRRKGVAIGLLSAIRRYAKTWSEEIDTRVPMILSVDNDNTGAIQLYEKFGFEYTGKNEDYGTMILWP